MTKTDTKMNIKEQLELIIHLSTIIKSMEVTDKIAAVQSDNFLNRCKATLHYLTDVEKRIADVFQITVPVACYGNICSYYVESLDFTPPPQPTK